MTSGTPERRRGKSPSPMGWDELGRCSKGDLNSTQAFTWLRTQVQKDGIDRQLTFHGLVKIQAWLCETAVPHGCMDDAAIEIALPEIAPISNIPSDGSHVSDVITSSKADDMIAGLLAKARDGQLQHFIESVAGCVPHAIARVPVSSID